MSIQTEHTTRQKAEYPGAEWHAHGKRWAGRSKHQPRYVIIHASGWPGGEPTAADVARFYARSREKFAGPHYIVGRSGEVVQCVREEDAAWSDRLLSDGHDVWWGMKGRRAGNPAVEVLSVEVVKTHTDNRDSVTLAQADAAYSLIDYLCTRWEIPRRWADAEGGITGAFSIDPVGKRLNPGPFPWAELFHQLELAPDAPLPTIYNSARRRIEQPLGDASEPRLAGGIGQGGTVAGEFLSEFPGFLGMVEATDAAEQFNGQRISAPADIFGWIGGNITALILRLLLIAVGVALLLGLLVSLARGNAWLREAGGDALALAMP